MITQNKNYFLFFIFSIFFLVQLGAQSDEDEKILHIVIFASNEVEISDATKKSADFIRNQWTELISNTTEWKIKFYPDDGEKAYNNFQNRFFAPGNPEVELERLRENLEKNRSRFKEKDALMVYYIGHGWQKELDIEPDNYYPQLLFSSSKIHSKSGFEKNSINPNELILLLSEKMNYDRKGRGTLIKLFNHRTIIADACNTLPKESKQDEFELPGFKLLNSSKLKDLGTYVINNYDKLGEMLDTGGSPNINYAAEPDRIAIANETGAYYTRAYLEALYQQLSSNDSKINHKQLKQEARDLVYKRIFVEKDLKNIEQVDEILIDLPYDKESDRKAKKDIKRLVASFFKSGNMSAESIVNELKNKKVFNLNEEEIQDEFGNLVCLINSLDKFCTQNSKPVLIDSAYLASCLCNIDVKQKSFESKVFKILDDNLKDGKKTPFACLNEYSNKGLKQFIEDQCEQLRTGIENRHDFLSDQRNLLEDEIEGLDTKIDKLKDDTTTLSSKISQLSDEIKQKNQKLPDIRNSERNININTNGLSNIDVNRCLQQFQNTGLNNIQQLNNDCKEILSRTSYESTSIGAEVPNHLAGIPAKVTQSNGVGNDCEGNAQDAARDLINNELLPLFRDIWNNDEDHSFNDFLRKITFDLHFVGYTDNKPLTPREARNFDDEGTYQKPYEETHFYLTETGDVRSIKIKAGEQVFLNDNYDLGFMRGLCLSEAINVELSLLQQNQQVEINKDNITTYFFSYNQSNTNTSNSDKYRRVAVFYKNVSLQGFYDLVSADISALNKKQKSYEDDKAKKLAEIIDLNQKRSNKRKELILTGRLLKKTIEALIYINR